MVHETNTDTTGAHSHHQNEKSKKILILYFIFFLAIVVFLAKMFDTAMHNRNMPSITKSQEERAKRGAIVSSDGFHIATTQKLFKAIINTNNLDSNKKELFIKLFAIYTSIDENVLRNKINNTKGQVTLSYSIDEKEAKLLRALGHQLLKLKVFKRYVTSDGRVVVQGLDILESGAARNYAYDDLLTPIIGYIHKVDNQEDGYTTVNGIKGIEKSYEKFLEQKQDGTRTALRDVNNYQILNRQSTQIKRQDGPNVILNIPVALQRRAEHIATLAKEKYEAKEVLCSIMHSSTGNIVTLASSNRFAPKAIRVQDYDYLNANAIEYQFEPGSVIKPLVFARLLEAKKVSPYDIINTYNGRMKIGKKVIVDEHKEAYMSAENVIVYSSNIGMAQLGQRLGAIELYQGLYDFGLSQPTHIDLPYEKSGSLPTVAQLNSQITQATASYGYGMRVTFMQMMRAYNTFNSNGTLHYPKLVSAIEQNGVRKNISSTVSQTALNPTVANRMKQILIKTVKDGTGRGAFIEGLEIGGKTGTAHMVEKGKYIKKYNSSFFGFANDEKNGFTIGVTVIEPNKHYYFASTSAVPVFKSLTQLLVEFGYLVPNIK